jgi:hypothetical protein
VWFFIIAEIIFWVMVATVAVLFAWDVFTDQF